MPTIRLAVCVSALAPFELPLPTARFHPSALEEAEGLSVPEHGWPSRCGAADLGIEQSGLGNRHDTESVTHYQPPPPSFRRFGRLDRQVRNVFREGGRLRS